ncbi:MAG: nitroreductase family protein [Candidatus Bathyarchaeota archaeon]|nr:nitroreductase family protein [Candidatus Bathyarchaeota archaeon]
MNFEEVLLKRRSIRRYKDAPIPREKILKILEAARIAPSASNKQPWHFIVVEKKETIKQLAKSEWAAKAPLMIVGLADQEASPNWCSNDLGIAFEHIALAATNLGLGTCWMGQTGREELIRKLLDIPDKLRPVAVMPIGVPDETPPPKERKSLDDIVSWEKFASSSTGSRQ